MAITKPTRSMLSTGISDSSDATFLTADSSENATFAGNLTVSGNLTVTGTTTQVDTVTMNAQNAVLFEGATADAHETTLTTVDPTGDRTISLPNVSGTLPVLAAASATAITATPAEINLIDGGTARGTTALASGDGILINDAGTMRMTDVDTVKTFMGYDTDAAQVFNESGAAVDFRIEGDAEQNLFFVDGSADKIGIGTASPSAGLMVQTSTDGTGLSGDDTNVAYFQNQEATAGRNYGVRVKAGSNATDYAFRVDTSDTNSVFEVEGTGNVGIGTASPSQLLDVNGGNTDQIRFNSLRIMSNTEAAGSETNIMHNAVYNSGLKYVVSDEAAGIQMINGDTVIRTASAGTAGNALTFSETIRFRSDNIICIGGEPTNIDTGENNAYSFLRIRGNTYGSAYAGRLALSCGYKAYQLGTNDGIGEIWFADDTGGDWAYIACQAAAQGGGTSGNPNNADDYPGKLLFATTADGAGSPTLHLTIDQNGRLLHGRTSAVNDSNGVGNPPLQIENATPGIHFYGTGTGNYSHSGGISFGSAESGGDNSWFYIYAHDENFHIYNNNARAAYFPQGSTATWQYGSDRRLKENINDLTLGLDTLNNLKPRKFNWKEDGLEDIGFIAQEVQDLIPLAVSGSGLEWEDGEDQAVKEAKTLKIANDKLIPVLVKAIQELSTELDAAKARITTLEG